MLITVLGEVVGSILSGNMPTNVANAFGNWVQLIAQVIVMFNAQQQYSQAGPGRYYSPDYRNISNPFTAEPSTSDGNEQIVKKKNKKSFLSFITTLVRAQKAFSYLFKIERVSRRLSA